MNEPSPALRRLVKAYEDAPTGEYMIEAGLAAAILSLADSVVPAVRTPPDDFDLEEWGRYSKQASIRRRMQALARELQEIHSSRSDRSSLRRRTS